MMPSTIGNTKDLNASRTEALHGLLSSLGHTNDGPSSDATLSTEQLQKLSDKINEILGDGTDHDLAQSSQLVNEDGLPIIDILEPEDSQTSTSPSQFLEQDFIPLPFLSLEERERRGRERDRILDLLEEEERSQQLQEEQDAEEAIRKRKESAKAELDQLKAARELQKKMGRALVRSTEGSREDKQEENARSKLQIPSSVAKKRVSFADVPVVKADDQQTSRHQSVMGDVIPGRLRAQTRIPPVSAVEAQRYPMKMHVVERHPAATATFPFHNDADSDDESSSSAGHISPRTEGNSSDEENRSSSRDNDISDDEPLEEGFDYCAAQHHREIALEYYKRRHDIGAETAKAMAAHTLDDYEQHEASNGQLPLSHFRADRMAAAYDKLQKPLSTSLGQTVIPASGQKSLRNSVRLGTLENGQLVGGDSGESGSEDENVREVIQMLRTGSIQNAGPDFKPSSMSATTTLRGPDTVESPSVGPSTAAHGAKSSRFKLARGGGMIETTTLQDNNNGENDQSQPAISNVVERKVPRPPPSQHFPINRHPPRPPANVSESAPPFIVDSPSFPMTASTSACITSSSTATIDPRPPHQTQLERPPLVKSSATQDSMTQSRMSQGSLSAERLVSKFMAERKK